MTKPPLSVNTIIEEKQTPIIISNNNEATNPLRLYERSTPQQGLIKPDRSGAGRVAGESRS
jgi:hypothetical protein